MDLWGYQDYLNSVRQDMKFGMESRKYNVEESFGFAHEELLARLEEHPYETPLALTALAVVLNEYENISILSPTGSFVDEISSIYKSNEVDLTINSLSPNDVSEFKKDMNFIRNLLNL